MSFRAGSFGTAALIFSLAACGDSTGTSSLSSDAALHSLSLGVGTVSTLAFGPAAPSGSAFTVLGSLVNQANVTIDGKSQTMFAIGLRETFPAGTCAETLFIIPSVPPPLGVCTSPEMGSVVILWQSHSADSPPDRLLLISGNIGTSNFNFDLSANGAFPALALYVDGQTAIWSSTSGTLTTQVSATNQSCALPLPPYAKSATCSIATFDEQANITLEQPLDPSPTPKQLTISLPRQNIGGVWQAITATQPITLTQ